MTRIYLPVPTKRRAVVARRTPRGLSAPDKARLDATIEAMSAHTRAVARVLMEVADLLADALSHDPEAVEGRGAAFNYLSGRVDPTLWSRATLYNAVRWGRSRAEVRALPGKQVYFEQLGMRIARLLEPLLPMDRERIAKDIVTMRLKYDEVVARLLAEGLIKRPRKRGPDPLARALTVARVKPGVIKTWSAERCAEALAHITKLRAQLDAQEGRILAQRETAAPSKRKRRAPRPSTRTAP